MQCGSVRREACPTRPLARCPVLALDAVEHRLGGDVLLELAHFVVDIVTGVALAGAVSWLARAGGA